MEITGCDSVVFTFSSPPGVFARVLASTVARWPDSLVDVDGPNAALVPASSYPRERLPAGVGWLLFYRDHAMVRHMDRAAYAPMADGDGPFSVVARVRRGVEFEASGLEESRVTDDPPRGAGKLNPYRAWLCSPMVYEFSAVTPGDPDEHPFSTWVLNVVKRACVAENSGR